jgi:hypothetical protein
MTRTEVGGLLKEAAVTIRNVTQERDAFAVELDGLKKEKRAGKLADRMVEKGIIAPDVRQEKIAELMERDDLRVLEEAVELSTSESLSKIAAVGEAPAGDALDPITRFLLGSVVTE